MLTLLAVIAPEQGHGSGIETLLMPGKVSAAHAKLETECAKCHDRADRNRESGLCLDCHADTGADVRARTGFHGRLPGIERAQCRACHAEHLGRDADIVKLSRSSFDHAATDFPLAGAHSTAACAACHRKGAKFRQAPGACVECHRADDAHAGKLGSQCGTCHEASGWTPARFDHGRTKFALRDRHAETPCVACHAGNRYQGTPTQCASCHSPDDVHRGTRGADCASCHGTTAWRTSKFDHLKETGFGLVAAHAALDCQGCHKTASMKDPLPRDCVGCHRADDTHATRFGTACERCHSSVGWRQVRFEHARDAKFELVGAHARLDCHACHSAAIATQKLGTECVACHRTRDVHSGHLGSDCTRCHGVEGWRRDVTFDHDLTSFTLVGLHVVVPCHACHETPSFRGAATACDDCHRRDDRHKGSLGKECEHCHSPSGWGLWEFDHGDATGFALAGAHARATCEGCHRRPPDVVELAGDCASCHTQDDVHTGQFGRQCQRCHDSTSFKEARLQ